MSELTRAEVRANREKWARFLMQPGRKKATGVLDEGDGYRCCLGHGAYCLGVPRSRYLSGFEYGDGYDDCVAPQELIQLVGLHYSEGNPLESNGMVINGSTYGCLTAANDSPDGLRPKQIGEYLLSVIEGGPSTPFIPLSEYKEAQS